MPLDSLNMKTVFHLESVSYADSVGFYDPGAMGENTGGEPDTAFQKPAAAIGSPDFKCVCLGSGGNLVLHFKDNVLINGPGPDLYIYQTDTLEEEILVWISSDGKVFKFAGRTSNKRPYVDIQQAAEPGEFYTYVKLRDDANQGEQSGACLGANIDAVSAIHTARKIVLPSDSLFQGTNIIWKERADQIISELGRTIGQYDNIRIKIFVHTHQTGTHYFNQIISQQRAGTIKNFLVDVLHFDENIIQALGMGNQYPLVEEISGTPESKNRRVEIFIHPDYLIFPIKR